LSIEGLAAELGDDGRWAVSGMVVHAAGPAIEGLRVHVTLTDTQGRVAAEQVVPAALGHLAAGERSPFFTELNNPDQTLTAHTSPVDYQTASFTRGRVEVSSLEPVATGAGGVAVFGWLHNPADQPVVVSGLSVLGSDGAGHVRAMAVLSASMSEVQPGESVPFVATSAAVGSQALNWSAYPDALVGPVPQAALLSLASSARLLPTAQGLPIVVGAIRNDGNQARWVRAVITLQAADEVLGMAVVSAPMPITPGEILPFAAREFPGLAERLQAAGLGLADLRPILRFDDYASRPAEQASIRLDVSVTSYDVIGSNIVLKGQVENHIASTVQGPAVLVAVRATQGGILSGGWQVLADELGPGQGVPFLLLLPLPRGVDASMLEFDVHAEGLPKGEQADG
jgi:hypothetical protein